MFGIIPSNPILFSGTLRENLDPNFDFNDEEIWDVLQILQLKEKIEQLNDKLLFVIANFNYRSIFNSSQLFLISFAKIFLNKYKIIIYEEVELSSVDCDVKNVLISTFKNDFFTEKTIITLTSNEENQKILDYSDIIFAD